jgi:HAE1 family hydrophobic/amphiphilic exporter-1
MTMLALTLSVGFVVDDAIVMLENIVRHIEGGMRPFEAALKGSREIGFTIVSITFSLIAVFIPVLLMGGMVGRVFREFAVTIAVAIVLSGFVSLTLTPMLCARVLKEHREDERQIFILRLFEAAFRGLLRAYEMALGVVLRYKSTMLVVTVATMIGTVYLYYNIPKGFFPVEDTGFISAPSRGRRTSRSRRCSCARPRSRRSCRRIRRSTTSTRRSGPAGPTRPTIPAACSSRSSRAASGTRWST